MIDCLWHFSVVMLDQHLASVSWEFWK